MLMAGQCLGRLSFVSLEGNKTWMPNAGEGIFLRHGSAR